MVADLRLALIVARLILPPELSESSEALAMTALAEADVAADESWRAVRTRDEFAARQREVRSALVGSLGGFPRRTPLNVRITGAVTNGEGIRIEKVLFESQPNFFVSANVYVPAAGFKPPYPAILVPCGHANNGKAFPSYQYAGLSGARAGFLTLVYDPVDQGERIRRQEYLSGLGHNWAGPLADRLGWSFGRIRVWDAMRALDCLSERGDVDPNRLCVCGTSGGGTVTSLVMALDDRVKAAAPSCFLSTLHDTFDQRFPSDSEQEHFGQLAYGMNHLGYILLRAPSPVLVCGVMLDVFPYKGTVSTFAAVESIARRFGWEDRFALVSGLCKHGWPEGSRMATIGWFRKWANGERDALKGDFPEYRRENVGLSPGGKYGFVQKNVAEYLPDGELHASPGGRVLDLPGARSVHDLFVEELDRQIASRPASRPSPETVVRLAGIRVSGRPVGEAVSLGREMAGSLEVERLVVAADDGTQLPAVLISPPEIKGAPVIICGDSPRTNRLAAAQGFLAAGAPVLLPDLSGWGEIGRFRRKVTGQVVDDETLAMTWYPLGRTLVGIRAENLIDCARFMSGRFSAAPRIVAFGRAAIPAVHARYVAPDAFAGRVEAKGPPPSWEEEVRTGAKANFADSVHGALAHYDWPDLLFH